MVTPVNVYVGTVIAKICTEYNVPDSAECRLWQRYMTNTYELLTKTNKTVSEAGLLTKTNKTVSEAGLYGGQVVK